MSEFIDKLMVKYLTPANLLQMLQPANDPGGLRVQSLLEEVYDLLYLTIRSVDKIEILDQHFQAPIGDPIEVQGTFERITPQSERTFATFTAPRLRPSIWAGMELDLRITTRVEIDLGALETITSEDLAGVATQAEFEAKFQFIDMAEFMTHARVATFQELKAEFPRLLKLQYAQPPVYDPTDPKAVKVFRLPICVVFEDAIDLVASLRELKAARLAAEISRPHVDRSNGDDVLLGSAWMVIFPSAAITAATPTQVGISSFFAAEGFVAAFDAL